MHRDGVGRGRAWIWTLAGAVMAALFVLVVASANAAPASSPELVPFTGTRSITATWGAPSGGYHSASKPAIDVYMPTGTPVYATGSGQVRTAKTDPTQCNPNVSGMDWCLANRPESGSRIYIAHPDGRISKYLHLSRVDVSVGQQVSAGQQIALSGNTGISTGPHLHYEETNSAGTPIDPGSWLACYGSAEVWHNGLQGRKGDSIRNDGFGCHGGSAPPDDSSHSPIGNFEELRRHPGGVWVRGWIVDPDSHASTYVHVYAGTGELAGSNPQGALPANLDRPDVAAAIGKGAAHGFSGFLRLTGGNHRVCIYGINIAGTPGGHRQVSCKTMNVSPEPFGTLDSIRRAPGGITGAGWAIDPDTDAPITVHLYSGTGQLVAGNPGASHLANLTRADVPGAHPGFSTKHGFDGAVKAGPGRQTVCAYAINAAGTFGQNRQFGCRSMNVSPEPMGALESVTRDGDTLIGKGWAIDPDTDTPITVHLYSGDGAVRADGGASTSANQPHPLAAQRNPGWSTSHGFSGSVRSIARPEAVCAYALNATGTPGTHQKIGCISEAQFLIAPPKPPPPLEQGVPEAVTPPNPVVIPSGGTRSAAPKGLRKARIHFAVVVRRGNRLRIGVAATTGKAFAGRRVLVQRKIGSRYRALMATKVQRNGKVRAIITLNRKRAGLRGARGVRKVVIRLALPKTRTAPGRIGPARSIALRTTKR